MTRRDRLLAAMRREQPDRPPVRVYGAMPSARAWMHPSFHPLIDLAIEKTDVVDGAGIPGGPAYSAAFDLHPRVTNEPIDRPGYVKRTVAYPTAKGDLYYIDAWSDCGYPRQNMKHLIADEKDAARFLSVPDEDLPFDLSDLFHKEADLGDQGIVAICCNDPGYWIHWMLGSVTLAFWSIEKRDLLHALYDKVHNNTEALLKRVLLLAPGRVLSSGGGGEKWIPPLQSPADFDEFLAPSVKRIADLVHENDGLLWYHCHGRVRDFISRFADAGVDCIHPVEPPPMGDVTLAQAKEIARGRIALEGNIQLGDLLTQSPDEVRAMVRAVVKQGRPAGGFILGTSGGIENVSNPALGLSQHDFDRWKAYIEAGLEQ